MFREYKNNGPKRTTLYSVILGVQNKINKKNCDKKLIAKSLNSIQVYISEKY